MSVLPIANYAEPIVETVREPLLVLDEAMRIQQANRAFYQTFRLSPERTLGVDLFELDQGRWQHRELRRLLEEILPHETVVEDVQFEQQLPTVGRRVLLVNARRIAGEDVDRPLILLAMEDVTEQVEYREKMEQLNAELEARVAARTAELERANKELESFSYSVSHDLRAPLRSIDGFSRILLEDYADQLPDDAQRYLHRVRSSTQQMGELVDDLLSFSRMSRRALQCQSVNPEQIVASIVQEARADWPEHPATVHVDALPPCDADPKLLKQVFFNLVSNAFKFTSKCAAPSIRVGADTSDAGDPVYFVADDGAGFDARYAHKLFTVFQRLHHESEFPGTGVGLALVQRIIERHGGEVWARSKLEVGTTLYFTLPRKEPS
jgi:PAS domain S-box-containing protein